MRAVSIDVGDNGAMTVVLRGEVDFTQASPVAIAIREAIDEHRPRDVRIDLAEVTFLDSSGLGVLVHAMKAAEQIDARFLVRRPTPQVYDQLELAGLLEVFGVSRKPGD